MEITPENLKYMVLAAIEDNGYYDALWGHKGGKEAREEKGYYQGYADAFLTVYGVKDFHNSPEALEAYQKGKDRYYNQDDENEED